MKIIKTKNYKKLSSIASSIVIQEIKKKPSLTICLPTGKTPLRLYKNLTRKKNIDFSKIKFFNLDEYYPIKKSDKRSFNCSLRKNLLNKINVKEENISLINSETKNPKRECIEYEKEIKRNPIDLVILGVGINGHIAFNEPGSKVNSKTRLVKLTKETIKRNSTLFKKIPKRAITLGIKTILSSKKIILLASGKEKAMALSYLNNKKSSRHPLSFIKNHKNLIVITDKKAGRYIK
jgi:glucosamine-6-phosphate deaminase